MENFNFIQLTLKPYCTLNLTVNQRTVPPSINVNANARYSHYKNIWYPPIKQTVKEKLDLLNEDAEKMRSQTIPEMLRLEKYWKPRLLRYMRHIWPGLQT